DGGRVLALDADGDVVLTAGELRLLGAHGLQEGLVLQRLAADLRSVHVVIEHRLRDVLNFLNGERHFGNPSRTTRSWRGPYPLLPSGTWAAPPNGAKHFRLWEMSRSASAPACIGGFPPQPFQGPVPAPAVQLPRNGGSLQGQGDEVPVRPSPARDRASGSNLDPTSPFPRSTHRPPWS